MQCSAHPYHLDDLQKAVILCRLAYEKGSVRRGMSKDPAQARQFVKHEEGEVMASSGRDLAACNRTVYWAFMPVRYASMYVRMHVCMYSRIQHFRIHVRMQVRMYIYIYICIYIYHLFACLLEGSQKVCTASFARELESPRSDTGTRT